MSRISDILTGVQTAIEANASFTTTLATVLRRGEIKQDTQYEDLRIFVDVGNPEPATGTPYAADCRIYPVEVVIKFTNEERINDNSDDADAVNVLKGTYSDAMKTAMRTCNQWSTYPISHVYFIIMKSENLNYKEPEEIEDRSKRNFAIQQIWNFFTYE